MAIRYECDRCRKDIGEDMEAQRVGTGYIHHPFGKHPERPKNMQVELCAYCVGELEIWLKG